jgi:hypothetical protein
MYMMYAIHAALRRELLRIARVTARPDDDPKHVQRTAAGWEMFKSYVQVHHTTEDDMLWPPMRKALADDSHRGGVARRAGGGALRDRPAAGHDRCGAGRPRLWATTPGRVDRRPRDRVARAPRPREAEVAEDAALVDNLVDESLPDRIPVGVGEVVRHIDALRARRDDVFKAILRSQLRPAEERRCVGRDAGGNVTEDFRLCS